MSPPVIAAAPAKQPRRDPDDECADGHVDVEDPRPVQRARQRAAQQHPGGAAAAGRRAPDAERHVALAALAEHRGEDGQRGGGEERRAEALQRAEGDQRAGRPGDAVEQRAHREERHAGDEHAPTTEHVGESTAEQQDAAEEDRVGRHHPLQAGLREAEVRADGRERDVHDRDVQHHHELRRHQHAERDPARPIGLLVPHAAAPQSVDSHLDP
jgi:hypothetical protein